MTTPAAATVSDVPPPPAAPQDDAVRDGVRDGVRDFDFLQGAWRVRNRRLRRPLAGSTEWYEFDGRAVERPLWDGQGNLEEYEATLPDGARLRGLALRLYDPRARRWAIHWSNSATGTLDAPLTGAFRDGRGEFYGEEECEGRMVFVRFLWTHDAPGHARWEQAFSADAGRTWQTNWTMEFTRAAAGHAPAAQALGAAADAECCAVVELRHYTLRPGARDRFVALFDREFVETQEAVGARVLAQFRDLDRPDVFTWVRGFPDMPARAASLGAFYDGPVWAAHRDDANGMIDDSDDVRLLRPVRPGSGLALSDDRPAAGATGNPPGLVVATVYTLTPDAAPGFAALFEHAFTPRLAAGGARPVAMYETEPSANTFPRLPVREGEHAFVWFARYPDAAAYERAVAALAADPEWTARAQPQLARMLREPAATWRLAPTARSRALR